MAIIKTPISATRMTDDSGQNITLDTDTFAMIQKGVYSAASFFGDQTGSQGHSDFTSGLGTISGFSGFASILKSSAVAEKDPADTTFKLTTAESDAIVKRSQSIAAYGSVPEDIIEDFLFMLVAVNSIEDMTTIANAVQIPELADVNLLRNVMEILAVPNLEKIAYMASALSAMLSAFSKYGNAPSQALQGGDDISSILSSLSGLLGGFGGGSDQLGYVINTPSPTKALGHFMSELVTGKRIPMSVIAKNPHLQSPSFVGKAMFGEAPVALSNVDITQLFPKKIGVFPKPSNGGATTTFGVSNFGSFGGTMNVQDFVSKIMFNSTDLGAGSDKYTSMQSVLGIVQDITGAQGTDSIETNRPDNVIPMMLGLSGGMSGLGKAPFSADTFQQSWITSMSAQNSLQQTSPDIMQAFKSFL